MKIEDECGRLKRNMSPMFPDSCVTDLPDRSLRSTASVLPVLRRTVSCYAVKPPSMVKLAPVT
jgi:hypothetical protein